MDFDSDKFNKLLKDFSTARTKAVEGFSFTRDHAFVPEVGSCYEIHFGQITIGNETGFASAKIRVDGKDPAIWIDMESNQPLDPKLRVYLVQAYKQIS